MLAYLDYIVNKFRPVFQIFALGMFLFSGSLIYFLRDGIGLAKGSTAFTLALMVGPMFLYFPFINFKKLYVPNVISYKFSAAFIFLGFIYLMLYAPNRGWFTNTYYEIGVMIVIAYLYLFLASVSFNNLNKYFVQTAIIISGLGSFLFLIYLLRNPYYVLGSTRASITFGNSDTEGFGNPHIFAKVAFLGFVASVLYMGKIKNTFVKLANFGIILIFVIVLVLTQSMTTIATTLLFIGLYFYFNLTLVNVYKTGKRILTSPVFWVLTSFFIYRAHQFYIYNTGMIVNVTLAITKRVDVLLETFFPFLYRNDAVSGVFRQRIDGSASARIDNFATLTNTFTTNFSEGNILPLLFGNGYHKLYVDVPVLETLHSFGLIGFLLFNSFFIYISWQAFKEMRKPQSTATEFIAYAYLYYMLYTFSGGLIIDYIRWGFFAFVCRFLPVTIKKADKQTIADQ